MLDIDLICIVFLLLWVPNRAKCGSSVIFSNICHWFHISLVLHANWSYFQRYVEYRPCRSNFQVILCPEIDQNSFRSLVIFSHFTLVWQRSGSFACFWYFYLYFSYVRQKDFISEPSCAVPADLVRPPSLVIEIFSAYY